MSDSARSVLSLFSNNAHNSTVSIIVHGIWCRHGKKMKMLQHKLKTSTETGTDWQWWRTGVEHVHNTIKPAGEQYKQTYRLKTWICGTQWEMVFSLFTAYEHSRLRRLTVELEFSSVDLIWNESAPIHLTQCWFPGLAISSAKIYICFSQIEYTEAILSNRTRKLLRFEVGKMLICGLKMHLLCHLL